MVYIYIYIDGFRRLVIDSNIIKHKVAKGVNSIINNVVDDYFKIDYVGCVGDTGK